MKAILLQLPIPRINFGLNTGNVPLAAACLRQAADCIPGWEISVLPETKVSYAGDRFLIRTVSEQCPDLVGFTVFAWNMDRSVYLAQKIKERTGAKIVFGGPQVTEDTLGAFPDPIDFLVLGQGEVAFRELLEHYPGEGLPRIIRDQDAETGALSLGSPYVNGHLGLGPGDVMLLETQRGCPYKCGFCYYSKARKKRDVADPGKVLDGIDWAIENGAAEIYLMDPSFNARPGLKDLLEDISSRNAARQIPIISEIRAEAVTPKMAERYARAGFTQFEVGLQSTTQRALTLMNRPTDTKKFVTGVKALQSCGIEATIDLIFGLPGDTPRGFMNSVEFILSHGLDDQVQVFPLLVLPGTAFRKKAGELGLEFSPHPPYPVIRTRDFSPFDLEAALDFAEEAFDRAFLPFPDLEVSFPGGKDHYTEIDGTPCLAKLVLDTPRSLDEIRALSEHITSPFQVFFMKDALDQAYINRVTAVVSEANPFVPLELIFICPEHLPDTSAILAAAAHPRPHFLDLDQHYLYPEPGNRAILFTLVSPVTDLIFQGPMMRQVLLWEQAPLPGPATLADLFHLDGILIRGKGSPLENWQDFMAANHEDILPVSFADPLLQTRWISMTNALKYYLPILQA